MAAAYDLPVIPHVGGLCAYHLIISHMNSPMAENYVISPFAEDRSRGPLKGEPEPVGGYVTLSQRPGLGLELDDDYVDLNRLEV